MRKIQIYLIISIFIIFNFLIVKVFTIELNDFRNSMNNKSDEEEDESWFWNKEDYPNPYEKPPYCSRTKPSFVCDPDRILTRKEGK